MNRRAFFHTCAASWWLTRTAHATAPFKPVYHRQPPYAPLLAFADPGTDEFKAEQVAEALAKRLADAVQAGTLSKHQGCPAWVQALGTVRRVRFYPLPDNVVRYEIASVLKGEQQYRVGQWRVQTAGGMFQIEPVSEHVATAAQPLFADVTANAFRDCESFRDQLAHGIPYWRGRLDPSLGIDVYGNNGVSVGDIDNDDWDEIYVCQPGGLPNRLYRHGGTGQWEDITERAGVGVLDDTSCALFLDLRNSGHQDLVVLRSNGPLLFLNDGKGHFRAAPDAFRFTTPPQGGFTGIAAADYDRDGRVDLYLCTYVYFQSEAQYTYPVPYHDAQNGPPNFLFHNRLNADGTGHFADVTKESGLDHNNNRFSFAPAWGDPENKGWPDLYVANDFGRNNLYRNDHGRFQDVAAEAGVEDMGPGMSAAWFDYDGDGRQDLYVANMWNDAGQRVTRDRAFKPAQELTGAYRRHTKGNSLYHNRGDGTFAETGAAEGVEMGRWAWSSGGHDFDNDGTPEIFVTCGMLTNTGPRDLSSFFWRQVVAKSPQTAQAAPAYENGWSAINQLIREDDSWCGHEPNVFYVRRNGKYHDLSGISGLDFAADGRAFAVTDLDGDGCLDVIVKSRLGPQLRGFRNDSAAQRRALAIQLQGVQSNRDAIGARVEVDGQVKYVEAGSGYLSQHTKRLLFGLGDRDQAGKVTVVWPSGKRQEWTGLRAGFAYRLVEGSAELHASAFRQRVDQHRDAPVVSSLNAPALPTTWLWEPVPLPEERRGPALLCVRGSERVLLPAGVPTQEVNLAAAPAETVAAYSLFRRYLFDWRTDLQPPLLLLIDAAGRARKVYDSMPEAATVRADLASCGAPSPDRRALPFAGTYYGQPHRDQFKLGAAFLWAGYPEQALPYLQASLERSPENTKVLLLIGQIHLQANRPRPARAALEKALSIKPNFAEAHSELGGVADAEGQPDVAIAHYRKALELRPDLPYALLNLAQALDKGGDAKAAEGYYRRELATPTPLADAANGLGVLLAKQNRTDEARRYLQQAITLQRDHASAINNLGVLYLQLGQSNDAIAAFQYGLEAAPEEDLLYLNLGRAYARLGNRDQARSVMRRLLDRKPDSELARKALRELETP